MTTERACLLIADISGYTAYLSGVELDHAQDILGALGSAGGAARRRTAAVNATEVASRFSRAMA